MGPPLWIVERGNARVFLLGDMPGAGDDRWLTPAVRDAVAASDELWCEVPGDDSVDTSRLVSELGLSDVTLAERLGPARHGRFVAACRSLGAEPSAMETVRPWLAAQIVDASLLAAADVLPATRVDRTVTELARDAGATEHFELSVDEAIRLFGSLSDDAEVAYLDMVLDRAEHGAAGVASAFTAWCTGDIATVEELERRLRRRSRDLHRRIVADRTDAWLPRLDHMLGRPGTRFVVVGSLHLVGDAGLPALLRATATSIRRN